MDSRVWQQISTRFFYVPDSQLQLRVLTSVAQFRLQIYFVRPLSNSVATVDYQIRFYSLNKSCKEIESVARRTNTIALLIPRQLAWTLSGESFDILPSSLVADCKNGLIWGASFWFYPPSTRSGTGCPSTCRNRSNLQELLAKPLRCTLHRLTHNLADMFQQDD